MIFIQFLYKFDDFFFKKMGKKQKVGGLWLPTPYFPFFSRFLEFFRWGKILNKKLALFLKIERFYGEEINSERRIGRKK